MSTHCYQPIKSGEEVLFTVGFFSPGGKWFPVSDHKVESEAAARVHWLNGGNSSDARRRDQFAAAAATGLLARSLRPNRLRNTSIHHCEINDPSPGEVARRAFEIADKMMAVSAAGGAS